MSQYLENMELGDTIDVRGPNGLLTYEERGTGCHRITESPPLCAGVIHLHRGEALASKFTTKSVLKESVKKINNLEKNGNGVFSQAWVVVI